MAANRPLAPGVFFLAAGLLDDQAPCLLAPGVTHLVVAGSADLPLPAAPPAGFFFVPDFLFLACHSA